MGVLRGWLVATALALPAQADPGELRSPAALRELQARIRGLLVRDGGAGVGITLVDREGVIWVGGVGSADVDARRAVTADTLFRAASVAKSVTALALMQLVEQGRLSLDARLRELAPEVEFDNPWEATHPVRVAHLLEHTAGFDDSRFNERWDDRTAPRPLHEILRINPRSRRVRWAPGTRFSYSNENYLVAGYLIEKVTGRAYEDVVHDTVFAPLGMQTAGFVRTPSVRERLAQGYQNGRPVRDQEQLIRPAVGLIASPRDFAGYLSFWLARGTGKETLLSRAGIDRIESCRTQALTGPEQCYGLGNDLDQIDGYTARGHTGLYEGFTASVRYFPREGVGWSLLFNSLQLGTKLEVEREVLRFLLRGRSPPAPTTIDVPLAELRNLTGPYRPTSPPVELFALVTELSDGIVIEEKNGKLFESGFRQGGLLLRPFRDPRKRELLPSGPGAFRHPDEAVPSRRFVASGGAPIALLTPTGSMTKVSPFLFGVQRWAFFGAILGLRLAPALALTWIRGLLRRRPGLRPLMAAAIPLLASLAFSLLYELLARSPERWGRLNATTAAAFVLSWAFAGLAAGGLACAIAVRARDIGRWAKWCSLATSLAAAGLTVVFWQEHWIGIRLWEW